MFLVECERNGGTGPPLSWKANGRRSESAIGRWYRSEYDVLKLTFAWQASGEKTERYRAVDEELRAEHTRRNRISFLTRRQKWEARMRVLMILGATLLVCVPPVCADEQHQHKLSAEEIGSIHFGTSC